MVDDAQHVSKETQNICSCKKDSHNTLYGLILYKMNNCIYL